MRPGRRAARVPAVRMALAGTLALVLVLTVAGTARPAFATSYYKPKTVLLAGDSLTSETRLLFAKPGWRIHVYAYPGTAPCDWITGPHPNLLDLLKRRPAYLIIETAGDNMTSCMRYPDGARVMQGTQEFLDRYEWALSTIFRAAAHNGVRVVYVAPPPMFLKTLNAANVKLATWVAKGKGHPGVIESNGPRKALSLFGRPAVYLPCGPHETAAMGCSRGWIAVRTINDPTHTHFCPSTKDWAKGFLCGVYSSGEHRWAAAVDKLII